MLEPQPGITKMELIVNDLLHTLMNCKHEENYVGLFECVRDTAFGKPESTKNLRYEVGELVPIVQTAWDIITRQDK